jgi:hypothetical protein
MLLIRPLQVTDDNLVSSSIAASEANWSGSTIYGAGDEVTVPTGIDLNFLAGTYLSGGASYGSLSSVPGYSYTRSGQIGVLDADGSVDFFSANTPPINGNGYAAYSALTNAIGRSFFTSWSNDGHPDTVTANSAAAPDGTTSATLWTLTAGTYAADRYQFYTASGSTFELCAFVKPGTGRYISLVDEHGSGGANCYANFDLVTGTVTATSGGCSGAIEALANGWFRLIVTGPITSAGNKIGMLAAIGSPTAYWGAGNSWAGETYYVWGVCAFDGGSFSDGGPVISTSGATASIGSPVLSVACPNGDYTATYTFADGSTQSIATTISTGTFTLPTYPSGLNRPYVTRAQLKAATGAEGHRLYQSQSGGTSSPVTMTIASPCVVTWANHGLAAGTPILFQTSGSLPTGISAGTVYYVLAPTTNTFNISATSGGSAINSSGTQSGTHTATANPNLNKDPTNAANAAFWLDIGATNRWAMFDTYNATATEDPSAIDVTVQASGRIDSVALLSLENAVSVRVVVSTVADGTLYDQTVQLTSTDGVADWYSYFFEEIERRTKLLLTGLPVYSSPLVRVVITGTGTSTVKCGTLVIGMSKDLGETQHDGAQVGIIDYSRKEADAFGNYTIVERAFSDRGSFKMRIAKGQVDGIKNVLSGYRATPAVYSASPEYNSTLIFGFFREFNIEIDYPLESLCSLEIEGLT